MDKYIANLDINNFIYNKELFISLIKKCDVAFYYYDANCCKVECQTQEERKTFIEFIKKDSIYIYMLTGPVFWHNKKLLPKELIDKQLDERLFYIIRQNGCDLFYISEPNEWEQELANMAE